MDFRPTNLEEYIGQEHIKKQMQIAIKSALLRREAMGHVLMHGPPGLGKTTLARVIAEELHVPFYSYLSSGLNNENAVESLFYNLPRDGYNMKNGEVEDPKKILPCVIFLDEIHMLKKSITELLHTALEDFVITLKKKNHQGILETGSYWIPHFTLIAATNYVGNLPQPFVNRFSMKIGFEIYGPEAMKKIVRWFVGCEKLSITDEAVVEIANRSRGTPRTAKALLSSVRDHAVCNHQKKITITHTKEAFDTLQIDELGLTKLDRKILKYLATAGRPVGARSIAQAVDEELSTIENVAEPWLVQLGLVLKTPQGRCISRKGLERVEFVPHGLCKIQR